MRIRRSRASLSALIVIALATTAAGCGNQTTTPTPVLATETLTGTIDVLGSASKNFTVNYAQAATDASITVTSLTTVAANTPLAVTIGVAFGSLAFDGSCTRAATYTANAATIGQELVATGAFGPGPYCVAIFDSGTLTEAANWTISLKHY